MNPFVIIIAVSYLLGSIPFGLLISRARGVDIRSKGSGNIGATNVFRMVGKSWGLLCFALDFGKGAAAAGLVPLLVAGSPAAASQPNLPLIAGAAAILGHNFPVWLRFKGGKGIATSGGVLAVAAPWAMLSGLATWLVVMALSRIVSLASIAAALAVAVAGWVGYRDNALVVGLLTALALVAIWRHRANIQRLLKGEEHRFGKKTR
jgi:glycerol-3-phosphate acyltransferase PlsY